MFASRRTRAIACAALVTTAAFAAADPAIAKKARSANAISFDAASLIPIPKFSGASVKEPRAATQGPATFFTIADALAKKDAGRTDSSVKLAAVESGTTLQDIAPRPSIAPARGDEPFGMQAFRAPDGMLWSKWRRMTDELGAEDKEISACASGTCTPAATTFLGLVDQIKSLNGRARLERVNRIVNVSITYTSDLSNHGEIDRWTTPLATLRAGKGDCEDYAILKRQLLIQAGAKPADVKIVLVRDTAVRLDHAVLAARADGQWFILDNRKSGFYEERDLPHYLPRFVLDQGGVNLLAVPLASIAPGNDAILPGLDTEDASGATVGSGAGLIPVL
jgi:predicted transglutaminase-like cysteine proteinase